MAKHMRQAPAAGANAVQPTNTQKRNLILKGGGGLAPAVNMIQLNYSTTLANPALTTPNVITFTPKNVGLGKRIFMEVILTFTTAAGTTSCALSPFGLANIFSNITLTDFQNQQRINCPGWALTNLASFRSGQMAPIASAVTTDTPLGYGNIVAKPGIQAPATVGASGSATCYMMYEIPMAYADNDLRGAIWMATTGANMTIQASLNQNFFLTSSGDQSLSVYTYAGTAPTLTSITVNFYQNYLYQLPAPNGQVALPSQDLNTIYQLLYTTQAGFTANSFVGIPYSNLRSFLSTTVVYDNGGTLNNGTDIAAENGFGLQLANNVFMWQYGPQFCSYQTRKLINDDTPKGMYYFSHRTAPIYTAQYGNMQFVFNPTIVNSGATLQFAYEFFASRATVVNAAALPSS
jgi:hypothetical protein